MRLLPLTLAILSSTSAAANSLQQPPNLCSTRGLCCKRRDSGCVVQHVFDNKSIDTRNLPCYCDHACLRLQDCCQDYREFCAVHDCIVSEWGPWSPCPLDPDNESGDFDCDRDEERNDGLDVDGDLSQRRRVILHQPINGGQECPGLMQKKPCSVIIRQQRCKHRSHDKDFGRAFVSREEELSSSSSSEIVVGEETEPESSLSRKDIAESRASCVEMLVLRASHGCHKHGDKKLRRGSSLCVEVEEDMLNGDNSNKKNRLTRRFRLNRGCHGLASIIVDEEEEARCCRDREASFRILLH